MDYQRLLDLTENILILRGGRGSGNWGHAGRKGKKGGSGKGGGLKRIGAKVGSSHEERQKAAGELKDARKDKKKGVSTKGERALEDAIGGSLGAQFSGNKLRQVKDLNPELYKSLRRRGIERLEKEVNDLDSTLKFSKARVSVLEKQKEKAKSAGRSFNPLKSTELRNLSDNIPFAESELKNLNKLLKNKSDAAKPEVAGRAVEIKSLLDLTGDILALRGGPTSGNWAHDGRPGRKGGSGSGGGFKRLRLKKGTTSRKDVVGISGRVRRKRKQLKDRGILGAGGESISKPKPKKKETSTKTKPASGKQVSDGLNLSKVPKKGKIGPPIRNTVDIINKVHSDGNLPEIPIRVASGGSNLGHYKYQMGSGKPIEIMVNRKGQHPHNTTAHEIGHFLDGQAWGRPGTPGGGNSEKDKRVIEKYQKVHSLMGESGAIKALKNDIPNQKIETEHTIDSGPFRGEKRTITYTADKRYINYLTEPKEQFARAYSQYIAEKSKDPAMIKELNETRGKAEVPGRINYPTQWSNSDFKPISKGFDDLFSELGWIEAE